MAVRASSICPVTVPSAPPDAQRLADNVADVLRRIDAARARGAHAAATVSLVAVTKACPATVLPLLPDAGIQDVGENRVQAAMKRRDAGPAQLTWHGIGHLQRNKVAEAVSTFDVFHAVDSLRLIERLDAELEAREAVWPAYLQVNASQEPQKGGFAPEQALDALRVLLRRGRIRPVGWMTMAAAGAEESDLRQTFRTLRDVRDEAVRTGLGEPPPAGLSMGMSNDFEIAVEEGATTVRVGRALFRGVWNGGGAPA